VDTLAALQKWYICQCNEDWEHQFGVEIGTLDNPGWFLKIDLVDTNLSGKSLPDLAYGVGEASEPSSNNWVSCKTENDRFVAYGCPEKLEEMIRVFLERAATAT